MPWTVVSRIVVLPVVYCFFNFAYNILWCLFLHENFLYDLGSNLTINSTVVPSRNMWMSCYISACRNVLGMLVTTKGLPSFASIANDIIITWFNGVFVCDLLAPQPLAVILRSCFSFGKIKSYAPFTILVEHVFFYLWQLCLLFVELIEFLC